MTNPPPQLDFVLSDGFRILERTPAVLRECLSGIPDAWLDGNEGGDTFSPREVVGHLIHGEKTDWIPRLRQIMDGDGDRPFDVFDRFAMRARPMTPNSELLSEFSELRRENLEILTSINLSASDFDLTGIHPAIGVVTVRQLLATWTAHDLAHLAQISRTMAKRYAEAVGPWRNHLRVMDRT
ncbi:MAG: DinB family protein [Rhodothermales bacterium]|nr:DinB family protein [Rhodothermales bacterium]